MYYTVGRCYVFRNNVTYGTQVVSNKRIPYFIVMFLLCTSVVVCPIEPSSSANPGCPGPESSVPVSSCLACPINSQVTDHWGEPCNRTGEVHPVDQFCTT